MGLLRGSRRWVVPVVCGGLLASCGHTTRSLTGTLTIEGGLSPYGGLSPQPGIVKVMSGGHVVASQRLFSGQTFRFDLTPDRYQVGSTGGCSTTTVTVEANSTTTTEVVCVFH